MTSLLSPAVLLSVMVGGAFGGLLRMWVGSLVTHLAGGTFPWGTLVVNLSGALAIGALAGAWMEAEPAQLSVPWTLHWAALVSGILGSYTTVSSFSLQTLALFDENRPLAALANIIGSLTLCLGGSALAFVVTRATLGA